MKLYFGLGLDGPVWFPEYDRRKTAIGEAIVGPLGLLRHLESVAGTTGPEIPEGRRLIAYLKALRSESTPERFYHDSFQVDALAVARHLLGVRDELRMAAWDGRPIESLSRTTDLSAVEKGMQNFPGIPDRLLAALDLIERHRKKPFESVTLLNSRKQFDSLWAKSLDRMASLGVEIKELIPPKVKRKEETDLDSLCRRLAAPENTPPKGDGTFRLLESPDPWTAARWLAAWMARLPAENIRSTLLIVPERYAQCLADAFHERGIPCGMATNSSSSARPALQTLILAIVLAWDLQDPLAALHLLNLPESPIPHELRWRLIEALQEAPAIGSPEWTDNLTIAIEALKKENDGSKRAQEAEIKIKEWFTPSVKHSEEIPVAALADILKRVEHRTRILGQMGKGPSWGQTAELAAELGLAVADLGEKSFSFERLLRLAREIAGSGVRRDFEQPYSGGPRIVHSPEAVLGPSDTVVWWDFSSGSESIPTWSIWSNADRKILAASGIELVSPFEKAQRRASFWPAPIMATSGRFLGVTFEKDSTGRTEMPHPLIDLLLPPSRDNRKSWIAAITVHPGTPDSEVSRRFENESHALQESPRSVWAGRDLWRPGTGLLPKPAKKLIADSLKRAAGCGLAFTLKDIGRLRKRNLIEVPDGNLLYGRIGHKTFEHVFRPGKPPSADQAAKTAREFLKSFLLSSAAAMTGNDGIWESMDVEAIILRAARGYSDFLCANSLEILQVEQEREEIVGDGIIFTGRMDQLLGRNGRAELLIDLKWSGLKMRMDELKSGKSFQLALYARMAQPGGTPPHIGFFFFTENRAMILSDQFKESESITGPSSGVVIEGALKALQDRLAKNQEGTVLADGVNPLPDRHWDAPCNYCEYDAFCGNLWRKTKK